MQANVEYFYRLFYECIRGSCYVSMPTSGVSAWLANLWLWIIIVGYVLSIIGLFLIVYTMMRLFELREREEKFYSTVLVSGEVAGNKSQRWQHIEALIDGTTASEWREAIIEADIMLDDVLAQQGYIGDGVGDRLKSVEPANLATLQDAWEAHKVRNQIAHQGSAFDLTEALARRTIARYAAVFKELGAI